MKDSSLHALIDNLKHQVPHARACWVALSGGLDSRVLLHHLAQHRDRLGLPLGAVHVDHGLQSASAEWAARCRTWCENDAIEFVLHTVSARPQPGESPEAAAREARYRALRDWLPAQHCLVTAHHQDDQAETLLLQLLRGSGPKGLAAMPESGGFGAGWLCRPLLDIPREHLLAYAREAGLEWIEDPSNTDTGYDRNYLRHDILPRLRDRWPGASRVLSRGARHQADAAALLDDLAVSDLGQLAGQEANALSVTALLGFTPVRRRNLLRYWLHSLGLSLPTEAILEQIDTSVLKAGADAMPVVHWPGAEVRRYRDRLYAMRPLPAAPGQPMAWEGDSSGSNIPGGQLQVTRARGRGLSARVLDCGRLQIGFRQGGESIEPAGRGHRHSLKHLFQERGIPPWERDRAPLIQCDGKLIAVAGLWIAEGWQAGPEEIGLVLEWSRLRPFS